MNAISWQEFEALRAKDAEPPSLRLVRSLEQGVPVFVGQFGSKRAAGTSAARHVKVAREIGFELRYAFQQTDTGWNLYISRLPEAAATDGGTRTVADRRVGSGFDGSRDTATSAERTRYANLREDRPRAPQPPPGHAPFCSKIGCYGRMRLVAIDPQTGDDSRRRCDQCGAESVA